MSVHNSIKFGCLRRRIWKKKKIYTYIKIYIQNISVYVYVCVYIIFSPKSFYSSVIMYKCVCRFILSLGIENSLVCKKSRMKNGSSFQNENPLEKKLRETEFKHWKAPSRWSFPIPNVRDAETLSAKMKLLTQRHPARQWQRNRFWYESM